jgi:hypothetical protein
MTRISPRILKKEILITATQEKRKITQGKRKDLLEYPKADLAI